MPPSRVPLPLREATKKPSPKGVLPLRDGSKCKLLYPRYHSHCRPTNRAAPLYDQPQRANRACMITVRFRPHLQRLPSARLLRGQLRKACRTASHLPAALWSGLGIAFSPSLHFSIRLLYQIEAAMSTIVLHNLVQPFLARLSLFPGKPAFRRVIKHHTGCRWCCPPAPPNRGECRNDPSPRWFCCTLRRW